MTGLAFFDDYAFERGHHPDLIVGLGVTAQAALYCPDSFLDGRPDAATLVHRPVIGSPAGSPLVTRRNLEACYADAAARGDVAFVNLFLDENWDSFPICRGNLPIVHYLHRPAELTGALGGVNAIKPGDAVAQLKLLAARDPIVVHTRTGERQALGWLRRDQVCRIGWPAATTAELAARFSARRPEPGHEPYVLLIGEALEYKGIRCLLEAVSQGLRLRIAGNLREPEAAWLARTYPKARVSWELGWVTREWMNELIAGAAIVAFPYLPGFEEHGGVSGAVLHALTFGKPIVFSPTLAAQVPSAPSCLPVDPSDVDGLRRTLTWAIGHQDELHDAAGSLEQFLMAEHSYEAHVAKLTGRVLELSR
jgi:hypothetical protein